MTREEILHLGTLARIRLTDEEADALQREIGTILEYVGTVDEIIADVDVTKEVGAQYNVMREDAVTNEPGAYTETLLAEMPEREGPYLKVKKILNPDN